MLKKLLIATLLVICSLGIAWLAHADDNPDDIRIVPYGPVKVVIDPSPDPRATNHKLYILDVAASEEYNINFGSGKNDLVIEERELHPGNTYILTATALDDYKNESVRSEPLVIKIDKAPPPEERRPPKWEPVPPPEIVELMEHLLDSE